MRLHLKLQRQGEKRATGFDIKNVRFAKPPRPRVRILAANARRAILRETDNLSVALKRPARVFLGFELGGAGGTKTDNLYVGPCRIRFRVLGVLLVGCKIFPSGNPLEGPTRQNRQNRPRKLFLFCNDILRSPLKS